MRLKRIKLAGFKSFVDPTNIPFPGDMTAIVGPNGCGKSNVIDAVRWVLGESSAKNLRGDAMTDVIFNGSSARKPLGQCSVELVFDNTANRIGGEYAAYNELSVKRVVTRDAQSFYYLNNSKCRRRDVTDIFLGTGLGPRSYAIIEQGMISRLIESKPQELRVFIEEAAGVSKYKERRKETTNRIKHTQENLARLTDVLTELGSQIDKLQRQAAAARRYKQLKHDQRTLQHQLLGLKWLRQAQKIEASQQHIDTLSRDIEAFKAQEQGGATHLVSLQTEVQDAQSQLSALQEDKFRLVTELTRLEQDQKYQQQRKQQLAQQISQVQSQLEAQQAELRDVTEQRSSLLHALEECADTHAMLAETLEAAQDNLTDAKEALATFLHSSQTTAAAYHALKSQIENKHSQLQTLLSQQMTLSQKQDELSAQLAQSQAELSQAQDTYKEADAALAELSVQHATSAREQEQLQQDFAAATQALKDAQFAASQGTLAQQSVAVELATLERFQAEQRLQDTQNALPHEDLVAKCTAFSDYFTVSEAWRSAFDAWLGLYGNVRVFAGSEAELLSLINASDTAPHKVLFCCADSFVAPQPNSLAEALTPRDRGTALLVPALLNDIVTLAPVANAHHFQMHAPGTIYCAGGEEQQGELVRQQQISELQHKLAELSVHSEEQAAICAEHEDTVEQYSQQLARINLKVEQLNKDLQASTRTSQQAEFAVKSHTQQVSQSRERLAEVTHLLAEAVENMDIINEEIAMLSDELSESESLHQHYNSQQSQLQQTVENEQAQVTRLQQAVHESALQKQKVTSSSEHLAHRYTTLTEQVAEKQLHIESLHEERFQLDEPGNTDEQTRQGLLHHQADLETQILEQQTLVAQLDDEIKTLEQGAAGYRAKLDKLNETLQSAKLTLEGNNVRAASIVEQLSQHRANLKDILPTVDEDGDEDAWQAELDAMSNKIQRLGAVNLAAVEEYEVQAERKAHLDTQFADLQEALATLENAMRKIDHETKTRFKSTFEQVNNDLKMLFPKVFGGGSAYLALTGDDMLDTGVTIMARPPGKKNSTIHLLSGGEKALTALSLVFAIFRLNPAPFCLLDEVDAPLDDANVGRFCKLVSEMSKTVQFIYISHNKIAMEMASHLTGVTMAEPGVSRMVAVDLDEAVAFMESE
jgi:chromosome segregation protein